MQYLSRTCSVRTLGRPTCIALDFICLRCSKDRNEIEQFSYQNDIIPSRVPDAYRTATQIELLYFTRNIPILTITSTPRGHISRGIAVHIPQDLTTLNLSETLHRLQNETQSILLFNPATRNPFATTNPNRPLYLPVRLDIIRGIYNEIVDIGSCSHSGVVLDRSRLDQIANYSTVPIDDNITDHVGIFYYNGQVVLPWAFQMFQNLNNFIVTNRALTHTYFAYFL